MSAQSARKLGFYWVRIVETFGEQWTPGELKEIIDAGASRRWLYVTGAATPHPADLSDIEWGPRIEPPPRAEEDDVGNFAVMDGDRCLINFTRISGRAKVYAEGPHFPSTSLLPAQARALAAWLLDTVGRDP